MPIRRKGKGWECRIRRVKPEVSRTFRSYRDAAEFERRFNQRISDHRVGRPAQYTLEEAIDRWLGNEAKALRSFDNLQNKVRVIYPYIKGRGLQETPEAAEAIRQAGLSEGLQPATINRRLAILRRVANLAYRRWGWLGEPLGQKIALLPGEEPRYVQATPQQAEKLIRSAKGKTKEAIRWAIGTGLRAGELLGVKSYQFRNGSIVVTKTKTGKPRSVPLAPFLRPQDFPYGLERVDVEKRFREARRAAGMDWLQFRDLRRTFGSWIVQKTRDLKAAQDLLGHTSMAITAKHYAHLLEGNRRQAVSRTFAGMARGFGKRKKAA